MSSETITSLSSTIVKTTEEAVKLVKTKEEIISQVNLVKGNVKLLETAIKSIIGSQEQTENPLRLEGNLALLKYYLAKLQYLLHASSKVGGGLDNTEKKQRSRHLVWHSINSCFKGRVCTGLIANLSIKDPLTKPLIIFKEKIETHRQKSMLKVNVVLVCNFIKPQSGDIDKKTFATKNHTIDINTNLKTWYRDNKKKNVLPLSLSENTNSNREPINLLVLSTENSNNNNSSPEFSKERTLFHFACIKKIYKEKVPFAIYADLESILEPCESLGADNGTEVQLRFIDSYRFMSSSLDKLSSYLEDEKKTIVRAHCNTDKEFNLLTRKGVFPYDYTDSWERFTETCLPSKTNFYSQLYDQCITDQDYQHALDVWKTFNIKTLGEYSDLYLKNDVLLLADIFENFRRTCLLTYELDPLHFYTAPGLAFDAMLKTTGVQLELLTDIEKLMFIERGIRGGVSQCPNRYAKPNNKYMKDEYDSNQESTYLMYFDINNLYGAAMSEYLPYGEFEFLEANEIENLDIMNIPDNAEKFKNVFKAWIALKKINIVLRFKQSSWLKKYIDLNTTLRQQAKNDFDKNFYKLMINSVYGKLMENVRKYRDVHKAKLLYTDTDSLIYQLNVPDIYEHIKEDSHRFDTSDYEPNIPYGIEQKNKKVPGLMKDENNGQIMLEFVGLRAKMYAYKVHNDKIVKRSKGSTLESVKKISFDDYKRTLFDHEIIYKPQHLIRSKKHCVFTIRQNKMILTISMIKGF
ncbi:hypothetical protein NQ315_012417 [Exocentrus adspersus]|uniref:DNA-directed DNA polymerase n=1 Tax=Exocentrus adspersus TaxID=1586481 RepID=A0AAV8VMZ4_9CUCU|nr:hypothetical protein NQ315_012417 [Exocentrus adspersus]